MIDLNDSSHIVFQPDAWYRIGGLVGSACHDKPRKRKDKGKALAGPLGVPTSDCDAPFGLLEATLDWIGREWKDKIDFVIWTGDNARYIVDFGLYSIATPHVWSFGPPHWPINDFNGLTFCPNCPDMTPTVTTLEVVKRSIN